MYPKEKEFADLLTKQGRKWQYESKRFNLGNTTYTPDFYLPKEKQYIEVVGSRQAYHKNKNKISKFKKIFPQIKLLIVDEIGSFYPYSKSPKEYGKPHGVRFKKNIDKALGLLCLEKDLRPSSIIQAAIECFLTHKECIARKKILETL